MPDQPRPVFISANQRDAIELILAHVSAEDYGVEHNELQQVQDAWDAAPADPTEAAERGILATFPDLVGVRISLGIDRSERAATACARSVLRKLGKPDDHEPPLGARCN